MNDANPKVHIDNILYNFGAYVSSEIVLTVFCTL